MLLNPAIELSQPVQIESRLLSGHYKVGTILHRGDTWGQDFVSEIDARSIEG